MERQEIISRLSAILAEEFEIDPSLITADAPLMETLELDSLDLVDVVVIIEQNFGVTLSAPDFQGVKTFDDFFTLIENKLND